MYVCVCETVKLMGSPLQGRLQKRGKLAFCLLAYFSGPTCKFKILNIPFIFINLLYFISLHRKIFTKVSKILTRFFFVKSWRGFFFRKILTSFFLRKILKRNYITKGYRKPNFKSHPNLNPPYPLIHVLF